MQKFGYYILFGVCRNERNHCETTKDNETYFQDYTTYSRALRFGFTMQYQ